MVMKGWCLGVWTKGIRGTNYCKHRIIVALDQPPEGALTDTPDINSERLCMSIALSF